jgi:Na+/pantothenate symporter
VLVFITPGILGTLFGVALSNVPGAEGNVLVAAEELIQGAPQLIQFLFAAAIIASVMSLIDGLFLASTYAIVVDLLHRHESIQQLDRDENRASRALAIARVLLLPIAAVSIWVIPWFIGLIRRDLFFFSFVVVVAQLALFGPVVVALRRFIRTSRVDGVAPLAMYAPIVVSAAVGFSCALFGGTYEIKWLTDGAGTFTLLVSLVSAGLIESLSPVKASVQVNGDEVRR